MSVPRLPRAGTFAGAVAVILLVLLSAPGLSGVPSSTFTKTWSPPSYRQALINNGTNVNGWGYGGCAGLNVSDPGRFNLTTGRASFNASTSLFPCVTSANSVSMFSAFAGIYTVNASTYFKSGVFKGFTVPATGWYNVTAKWSGSAWFNLTIHHSFSTQVNATYSVFQYLDVCDQHTLQCVIPYSGNGWYPIATGHLNHNGSLSVRVRVSQFGPFSVWMQAKHNLLIGTSMAVGVSISEPTYKAGNIKTPVSGWSNVTSEPGFRLNSIQLT